MKWIFYCLVGIHLVKVNGKEMLTLNPNENHRLCPRLLGESYQTIYS